MYDLTSDHAVRCPLVSEIMDLVSLTTTVYAREHHFGIIWVKLAGDEVIVQFWLVQMDGVNKCGVIEGFVVEWEQPRLGTEHWGIV